MNVSPFANALILTGPTASGKSVLALELAGRLNAEIVAVDSMTLYRGMDIGTAKPSLADRARVPHHLIDVLDPWESASVAWWLEQATAAVKDIESRGRPALLVGGTPFYLKALLCGLFPSPPADEELRRKLEAEGAEVLHARLTKVDPASARRLHPNDVRRVVRALEVWYLTARPLSEWQQQSWWDGKEPRFRPGQCLIIDVPRDVLCERIDRRVEQMFAQGWIDEVRGLRGLPEGLPHVDDASRVVSHPTTRDASSTLSKEASQALGYREIGEHLDGFRTLPETIAEIQLRSRQFAKRQLTWFRSLAGAEFCDAKLTFERGLETMAARLSDA